MNDDARAVQAAIIKQIKAEMGAKNWNQADLAGKVGMATSTLSRYLAGTRDMPLPVFAEISLALGLPIEETLARAERRSTKDPE